MHPNLTDSRLVSWEKKDEEPIRQRLSEMMKLYKVENGRVVSHDGFHMDLHQFVIASALDLKEIESSKTKRLLVTMAASRLRTCKRQDLSTLRRVLAKLTRGYLQKPKKIYRIVFPLNISDDSLGRRREFRTLGVPLRVYSWRHIKRSFELKRWVDKSALQLASPYGSYAHPFFICDIVPKNGFANLPSALGFPFLPLVATVSARNPREAFTTADNAFSFFRSVFNLSKTMGRVTCQGGLPRPLGAVMEPPVYGVFDSNRRFKRSFINTRPLRKYEPVRTSRDQIQRTRGILRALGPTNDQKATIKWIIDAIECYGAALSTTEWREAFLWLWQVLEIVTHGPNERTDMDELKKRVGVLLGSNKRRGEHREKARSRELLLKGLEACLKARNALVHRGRFSEDGLTDVNVLKIIVEHCISAVYRLRRKCPTWHDLQLFYELAKLPPGELESRRKLMRIVQETKKNP